jgi:hypothetical protein
MVAGPRSLNTTRQGRIPVLRYRRAHDVCSVGGANGPRLVRIRTVACFPTTKMSLDIPMVHLYGGTLSYNRRSRAHLRARTELIHHSPANNQLPIL